MRLCFLSSCCAAMLLGHGLGLADEPTPKDLAELRSVIEANFAACNREDADAVIATHHPMLPAEWLKQLKDECEKCFEETNLTTRLVSMYVNSFENPWVPGRVKLAQHANTGITSADVEIVQMTLPAAHSYADLEEYPAELSTDFRHRSALLPTHQVVKYTTRLWYDYRAKKWKIRGIIGVVQPVNKWPENTREIMQGEKSFVFSRSGVVLRPGETTGGRK